MIGLGRFRPPFFVTTAGSYRTVVRPSDGPVRAQGEVEVRAANWAPPLLRVRVLDCPGFGEI